MRTYKCKNCDFTAEGNSPSVLRAHAREAHGKTNGGKRGSRGSRLKTGQLASTATLGDKELALLNQCTQAFIDTNAPRDVDFRVLEYLALRFGPAAYADEATDADEPADEE